MEKFKHLSLKNKIFFSSLAFILLLSVVIAVFTRWVLISSLTSELKNRGFGIGHSIAERGREYILTQNRPELTNLIFDARNGESRHIVLYVFVMDKGGKILAHTFTDNFPASLLSYTRKVPADLNEAELIRVGDRSVFNISISVKEGIYEIGRIHVGVNKKHIDRLIEKLRITFLGFLSSVTIFFFMISHWLSSYITRPVAELIKVSEEISRGNYDITLSPESGMKCRQTGRCLKTGKPIDRTFSPDTCGRCDIYSSNMNDEVVRLADSFVKMTTRIRKSRERLKESEEKYKSLFKSGPNPIFVCDAGSLKILAANTTAEEVYGYSGSELVGMSITRLGPFDPLNVDFESEIKSKRVRLKERYIKKSGKSLFVNVYASPASFRGKKAVIVSTADISEAMEKENQLIQASKMTGLGKMSAGVAHELNQPLNAIKLGSEYLTFMLDTRTPIPENDLAQVVTEISGQVDRASDIIGRLRDFGRKADFSRDRIDVNDPVRSVIRIVERQLSLQNIGFSFELDQTLPPVLAHNNRLEQVVFNLVTNARDSIMHRCESIKTRRMIVIKSFQEDGRVCVSVKDNGSGIPADIKDRIFEAFFTTKEMGEGMGIGLSIISGIVKDYGGEIKVESCLNEGSTFCVSFPQAAEKKGTA